MSCHDPGIRCYSSSPLCASQEAQQACVIHAAVHYKRDKKWLLHSDYLATVTSFVLDVRKQFQPLRDKLGRPIFPSRSDSCCQRRTTASLSIIPFDLYACCRNFLRSDQIRVAVQVLQKARTRTQ